ncbi:MAG TPA: SIS domain-containing protein [Gemmatimonadaceae bacterium]
MNNSFRDHFAAHKAAIDKSVAELETVTAAAANALVNSLRNGGKLLTFGNGGSSAEAGHFAEELVGRYKKNRRAFPAMSLTADSGTLTCVSNDFGYETIFERQLEAFVKPGDVAVALSTSGKSENVIRGLKAAKAKGAVTIALTGESGLHGADADHVIAVPSADSAIIQEVHLILIHLLCGAVEEIA